MSSFKSKTIRRIAGKGIILFLTAVYLLFSVGIVKATHFCMGREASVAYFGMEAKKCPCSLFAKETDNCCADEHELIKLENEQKVVSGLSLSIPAFYIVDDFSLTQLLVSQYPTVAYLNLMEAPTDDLPPKVPRWKMNCTLVFYDDELIA